MLIEPNVLVIKTHKEKKAPRKNRKTAQPFYIFSNEIDFIK